MSVSTLTNFNYKENRLLFVKGQKANDDISLMTLPNTYKSISFSSLREMVDNFNPEAILPDAILVNLSSVSLKKITPILKKLKSHKILKQIPVIGLQSNLVETERAKLLQLGFSDCFCKPIDWVTIEKRVSFLNKFKNQLSQEELIENTPEKAYKMPITKRAFDILVASTLLICLSPLFLIVAIAIKLESKGAVFYASKRVGTGYQIFDFIKFRSMQEGADASLMKLATVNSYAKKSKEGNGVDCTFYKIKDDPRVTKIGKFIRKTSIDELPQFINVLRGEMSIVGNRPLPLYEAEKLTCDDWSKRFMAPAGLTGLWQVDNRGKDNLSTEERIQLDMTYAENYSLLMDIKIMIKTLPAMIQKD